MKNAIFAIIAASVLISIGILTVSWNYGLPQIMKETGAPAGHTGSPGDGRNCTACHTGPAAASQAGWITSNVPLTGYVPGATYSITAKATRSGHSKFGFEVSPQNALGTQMGVLVSISSDTQLTGGDKYITHSLSGTAGSNGSKTWSFNWTAPAKGSGNITLYGAFNITNASGTFDTDTIFLSTLDIAEDKTVGISDIAENKLNISVFPNPTTNKLTIGYSVAKSSMVEIKLYDLRGKVSEILVSEIKNTGNYNNIFDIGNQQLTKGIYFIETKIGNLRNTKKIVIE